MKLSQAIREGSLLGPQAHGALSRETRKFWGLIKGPDSYCALGAAFKAADVGYDEVEVGVDDVGQLFRGATDNLAIGTKVAMRRTPSEWPMHVVTVCPVCGTDNPLYRQIPHLNDLHKWTREQIADHVEDTERTLFSATKDALDTAKGLSETRGEARSDEGTAVNTSPSQSQRWNPVH